VDFEIKEKNLRSWCGFKEIISCLWMVTICNSKTLKDESKEKHRKKRCQKYLNRFIPGLQNQASSSMESSGAKKSNHLGAFTFSYNLSSTKTESILFQSIFSGSIAEKKKKRVRPRNGAKLLQLKRGRVLEREIKN
jgi:hypothetical protein